MYQIKKKNEDEFVLIANNKEIPFKRTVDIAKEMQCIDMISTVKVAEILAERGESYDNTKLRIERTEGNKTIIDESNLRRLEKKANEIATKEVLEKVYKKLFNKTPLELLKDIGISYEDEKGIEKFSSDITNVLVNGLDEDTPRNENTQGNRE